MSKRLTVHEKDGVTALYDIVFEDSFASLAKELEGLGIGTKKICIVSDSNVSKLYEEQVRRCIEPIAKEVTSFTFEAGEHSKTLHTVQALYEHLILEKFDRKDLLLAFGGGVVGDLTGYAAATYLRGISFIQIPTSLLSQVDSSVGGKTGVDFNQYKNMVGAFHQPSLVYMNLAVLKTLDKGQFSSGMGEVIKHGLIKKKDYFTWLVDHRKEIMNLDLPTLEEMIYESCKIKVEVVEKDAKEQGERALLNFGHTIGHSVEKSKHFAYMHGECVALGAVAAAHISWKRGYLTKEEFNGICGSITDFQLPITITDIDPEEIVRETKLDKKMESGKIKFILLEQIGKAVIDQTVTDEEMLDAVKYIHDDEECYE